MSIQSVGAGACNAALYTLSTPPKDLHLEDIIFGPEQWKRYFGCKCESSGLPEHLKEILESPCSFNPGYRKGDVQTVLMVPGKIGGKKFNLAMFRRLLKHLKVRDNKVRDNKVRDNIDLVNDSQPIKMQLMGASILQAVQTVFKQQKVSDGATNQTYQRLLAKEDEEEVLPVARCDDKEVKIKVHYCFDALKTELDAITISESYWVIITQQAVPGSYGLTFKEQKNFIRKQDDNYDAACAIEVLLSLVRDFIYTNKKHELIDANYSHCQETALKDGEQKPVIIGPYNNGFCLNVDYFENGGCIGMMAVRKL